MKKLIFSLCVGASQQYPPDFGEYYGASEVKASEADVQQP
jgi:hypothetical protein